MANDEYLTPLKYIQSIRNLLGVPGEGFIDLFSSDMANNRIKATRFFTKVKSAWDFEWTGNCYANPPYSRGNLPRYSAKLIRSVNHLRIQQSLSLVPNYTSEKWFQNLIRHNLALTCLTDHRIKFTTFENGSFVENSSPDFGNAFIYIGKFPDNFVHEFRKFGTIVNCI